jgi:uncharacterized protein YbcI
VCEEAQYRTSPAMSVSQSPPPQRRDCPFRSDALAAKADGVRDNLLVVMLEDTLTKRERALVLNGRAETVLTIRREFQDAMRAECTAKISELTGRNVVAMMSTNHIDPDLAVELFLLDGPLTDPVVSQTTP